MVLKKVEVTWSNFKGQGLWLLYCTGKGKLDVQEIKGKWYVSHCVDEDRECYGCHPRAILDFNPNKVKDFKKLVDSMGVESSELAGLYMTDEAIQKRLKPYEESKETWYWFRTISSDDLDAVYIFRILEENGDRSSCLAKF